jgi:allantoicase
MTGDGRKFGEPVGGTGNSVGGTGNSVGGTSEQSTLLPDLASRLLGGGVVATNDEFFAAADNLVEPSSPTFSPMTFGPKGQVYDGWETRRRRDSSSRAGQDWAIVRLGVPGIVSGVVVDTAFFTGNFPPFASLDACGVEGYPTPDELEEADWITLVERSALRGDTRNIFEVASEKRHTHVRLSIYPDGGVARLRVHGQVVPDPRTLVGGFVDLAALEHGGLVVGCSNMYYSAPNNLLLPGPARSMGEGWETARRRDDGNDWVTLRLGLPGEVRLVELDTSQFKGNAPAEARLRGLDASDETGVDDESAWFEILPRTRLQPDTRHRFRVPGAGRATHARVDIYPDGGMARLRLLGEPGADELDELVRRWFNALPGAQRLQVLSQRDWPPTLWHPPA